MPTSTKQLQEMIDFTEQDLTANRRGKLSAAQIEYLRQKARHDRNAVLILPFGLLVLIVTMVEFLVALPAVLLICLLIAGLIAFHQLEIDEMKHKKVAVLKGDLKKVSHTSTITHYAINVNGERFAVDRDFYYQIAEGTYIVYLLDETRQILGIEPSSSRATKAKTSANKKPATRTSTPKSAVPKDKPAKPRYSRPTKSA